MTGALDAVAVVTDLSGRYAHSFDHRLVDAYLDCFAADGVFSSRFPDGRENRVAGRDELRRFVSTRGPAGVAHVALAPAVLSAGDGEIVASTPFACLAPSDEAPLHVWGHYHDRIVRENGGAWRFAVREATVAWMAPSFHA